MSQQYAVTLEFTSQSHLLTALCALGWKRNEIEVHATPQQVLMIFGHPSLNEDGTPMMAEIIIRAKHVGGASSDLAFRKTKAGTWEALISAYDKDAMGRFGPYNDAFLGRLKQQHGLAKATAQYRAKGFRRVQAETDKDGYIHMKAWR